jgi:hypothetical protein
MLVNINWTKVWGEEKRDGRWLANWRDNLQHSRWKINSLSPRIAESFSTAVIVHVSFIIFLSPFHNLLLYFLDV